VSLDDDPLLEAAGISGDQLTDVLGLLAGSDITELDVTLGSTRLSLRRAATSATMSSPPKVMVSQEPSVMAIASPLVGIFRPSVSIGDHVVPGQSIGAIEALGMPTSVDAPQSGTVEELLVHDGSPVEYGEPLLILRRSPHPHAP
jgi:acetyl/propionyl-CoA carboxylase alpha subunit